MRSDIIPPNRAITVVLVLGILALIAYGAYKGDPATLVIVAVLFFFLGVPALLLFRLNRLNRQRPPTPPASPDDTDQPTDQP